MARMSIENDHRAMAVMRAIERAADAGRACPTNPELCGIGGFDSVSGPVGAIGRLARAGLIKVERFQNARQVTICATGKQTFVPASLAKPHWRDRTGRHVTRTGSGQNCAGGVAKEKPDDQHLPPAVYRDPCPRCGVRADLGCAHHAAPVSMGAF